MTKSTFKSHKNRALVLLEKRTYYFVIIDGFEFWCGGTICSRPTRVLTVDNHFCNLCHYILEKRKKHLPDKAQFSSLQWQFDLETPVFIYLLRQLGRFGPWKYWPQVGFHGRSIRSSLACGSVARLGAHFSKMPCVGAQGRSIRKLWSINSFTRLWAPE